MKRILPAILTIALLTGSASAGPVSFTLNQDAGLMLGEIMHQPPDGVGLGMASELDPWTPTTDPGFYGSSMLGQVGFSGTLGGLNSQLAWMRIGATGGAANDVVRTALGDPGHATGLLGYDTYSLLVANDNDAKWSFRLYLATAGGNEYWSSTTELIPGQNAILSLDLSAASHLEDVTGIGFEVEGWLGHGGNSDPSNPDIFHVSIAPDPGVMQVPVPGALALVLFGLGAGWPLRRYGRRRSGRMDRDAV